MKFPFVMSQLSWIFCFSLLFCSNNSEAIAQQIDAADTTDYGYENPADSLFPGYDSAQLIIDYYKTEGATTQDRYRYEIIVIDSLLSLTFRSPQSEDFHYIDYQKERLLSVQEQSGLRQTLNRIKLTQTKHGIPTAKFTGYAQEVLIVRSKALNIAGGLAWSAVGENADRMADREETSSIGGNYDAFFEALRRYFPDLNGLMEDSTSPK